MRFIKSVMTNRESLLEVDSKNPNMNEDSTVEPIIDDIRVDEKSEYEDCSVQYLSLCSDEWNEICSLEDVPEQTLEIDDEQLDDDFTELQQAVQYAYDKKRGMWRVKYDTYEDGMIKSLYIPLETPLTDDVLLCNIHDDEDNVKKKIKDINRPLRSLYTDNLYVDSIDGEYIRTDVDISSRIKHAINCSPKEALIISIGTFYIGFPMFLSILLSGLNPIIVPLSMFSLVTSLFSCLIWVSDLILLLQSDRKLYKAKSTKLFKVD